MFFVALEKSETLVFETINSQTELLIQLLALKASTAPVATCGCSASPCLLPWGMMGQIHPCLLKGVSHRFFNGFWRAGACANL